MTATPILERLARRGPPPLVGERCELCAVAIADRHDHVVDLDSRRLLCACQACALLFDGPSDRPLRRVPTRRLALGADRIGSERWERLDVPVSVAFFFVDREGGVVCQYPGAGGVTEADLPLDDWDDLVADVPEVADLEPEVEALLVRGRRSGGTSAYLVPIDVCYELAGLVRGLWRGIDGGGDVRAALDGFFADLAAGASTP